MRIHSRPSRIVTRLTIMLIACASATVVAAGQPAANATEPSFCQPGGFTAANTFVWTGAAGTSDWFTDGNWRGHKAPGLVVDWMNIADYRDTAHVCIGLDGNGTPAHVTIGIVHKTEVVDARAASIAALDLGHSATLTINQGSKFFVQGNSGATTSYVRRGSKLAMYAATLGGSGNLVIDGKLTWSDSNGFVSTQTTRNCDLYAPSRCSGRTTSPGTTTIATDGKMYVNGDPVGGVNLEDNRVIDNFGLITISRAGFIAADDGTLIKNESGARIRIANDGGIYEGRSHYGQTTPPALINNGTITKSGTAGTSVIGARLAPGGAGTVVVGSGTLTIGENKIPAARVDQGSSYGTGSCAGGAICRTPALTTHDHQLTRVSLPKHFSGHAEVSINENAKSAGAPAGYKGHPVKILAKGATSSSAFPLSYTLTLANSELGSKADHASKLRVYRAPAKSGRYVKIPACRSNGRPPGQANSCLTPGRVAVTGGVQLTVHTTVPNSRWVVV
jgi:hypothetical protein